MMYRFKSYGYGFLIVVIAVILFSSFSTSQQTTAQSRPYRIETWVYTPNWITAMTFAPDGSLFYTEKETGRVRLVSPDGVIQEEPVIHLSTDSLGERGLIGIAVDPDYENNGYVYVYHTFPAIIEGPYVLQRLVRFHVEDGVGSDPLIMLEVEVNPNKAKHHGGNLHFGADGMLYMSIGDNDVPERAMDLEFIHGKIHRFQIDGDELIAPEDNPWEDNTAYAIGLRNPIDFAFDPYSEEMVIFATENGPSCDDEINLILPGQNYGWRADYPCDDSRPGEFEDYTYPLIHYTPTIAPVGIEIYHGDQIPELQGDILFCAWNDGTMRRLVLDETRTEVIEETTVDIGNTFCSLDILTGPDGALYYASVTGIHRLIARN